MKALVLAVVLAMFIHCPAMAVETTAKNPVELTTCECETHFDEEMIRSYSDFFEDESGQHKAWQIIEDYEVCRSEDKIFIYESDITGFIMELIMAEVPYDISKDSIITIHNLSPEFKINLITGGADPVDVD